MFARYEYKAGTTLANMLSDVIAILSGQSNPANLSGDCLASNTYILQTVASGMAVYDATAGTNKKVIRSLNADGTYKYITLDAGTATSGRFSFDAYDAWNTGTHTGTNQIYTGSTSYYPAISTSAGGVLIIAAKPQYLIMTGYTLGAWDYTNRIIGERQREEPWDTAANGYSPIVASSTDWSTWYTTKTKSTTIGTDNTLSSASLYPTTRFGQMSFSPGRADDGNTLVHKMSPIYLGAGTSSAAMSCGYVQGGLLITTASFGEMGNELTKDGKTYYIVASASGSSGRRLAVPKE